MADAVIEANQGEVMTDEVADVAEESAQADLEETEE
jgi:hypothetical protein